MSRSTIKDPAKSKSSETFFKVLRFIGRYRFLLILSIILAAVSRYPSAVCPDPIRKCH